MNEWIQNTQNHNLKKRKSSHSICNQIKCGIVWSCEKTSLHGFRYISSKESSMFTRIFFACVSCFSFILCSYLIYLQLADRDQQSVITTVRSTAYPVWKIHFPSVTVCNFNVVYKDNIKNVMDVVKSYRIDEDAFKDMLYNLSSLITYDDLEDMNTYKSVLDGLNKAGYTTDRLMAELAHPCGSMIKKCFWQSEEVSCLDIFDFVRTSQGYCCAFNYYGTTKFVDNLDDPRKIKYQYVGGAGPNLGLELLLDVEESQYISSIRPSYGINVLVQDGFDYPDMDLIANTVLSTEELTISVTPRVYISTEGLRYLSYEQRHCLFEDEGNLEWTSTYSYKTCITQCRVKAILEYCGCTPYYYPTRDPKRFCTLLDVPCLQANRYKYNALEIMDNFFSADEAQGFRQKIDKTVQCKCYPQCNEQMFDFHIDKSKATPMIGFEFSNVSVVNIYYANIGCIKTERDAYFTWDRILASIGGIFGLCLGGSVISILECFYFFTKYLSHRKSVEPEPQYVKPPALPIYTTDLKYYNHKINLEKKAYNIIQKNTFETGLRNQ